MKHFGDITRLNGADLPIVDIVTGGSPCQDLSVAGKRAGLAGERSGLFMEQIRVIKEMREHDRQNRADSGADDNFRLLRPRYMVWENVPGAFSSNNGEDFRAVLEETARVVSQDAVIPRPQGKWGGAGCIMGDGWSIAWRVHDAQFWGVPQRRRRIALIADFGGETAPEILFERKSMSGDFEESGQEMQDASTDAERSTDSAISFLERAGCEGGVRGSLSSKEEPEPCQPSTINPSCSDSVGINGEVAETLDANYYKGCGERQNKEREVVFCLQGNGIDRAETAGCNGKGWREGQSYTLDTIDRPAVAYSFDSVSSNSMKSSNPNSGCRETEVSRTLDCTIPEPSKNQGGVAIVEGVVEGKGYSQDAYDKYSETEQGASVKASGGNYGGGYGDNRDTVGALCARDYKGIGNQYVSEGKCIVCDSGSSDTEN